MKQKERFDEKPKQEHQRSLKITHGLNFKKGCVAHVVTSESVI